MKLKVVIVDLEISPRAKKWGLRAGSEGYGRATTGGQE